MKRFRRWSFRLWQRRLWYQHTWWFQFAHGPLCDRFRHNVICFGRLHVCRSCLLLYAGLLGTLCGILSRGPGAVVVLAAFLSLAGPLLVASHPRLYQRWPRWAKDLLRAATGVWLALLFALLATPWWWLVLVMLLPLVLCYRYFQVQRRAVKAGECNGCPELGLEGVCSGYGRQAASVRVFQERMEEELNRPGTFPLELVAVKHPQSTPN